MAMFSSTSVMLLAVAKSFHTRGVYAKRPPLSTAIRHDAKNTLKERNEN
jgi:hypothetical protein